MTKSLTITAAALALVVAGSYLARPAWAVGPNGFGSGETIGQYRFADGQAQQNMEQQRADFQDQRQADFLARLETAVAAGQLSTEQQQLLIDKHQELTANRAAVGQDREAWQALSVEERQAARTKRQEERASQRAELETWASENGIDLQYLNMPQLNEGQFRQGRS